MDWHPPIAPLGPSPTAVMHCESPITSSDRHLGCTDLVEKRHDAMRRNVSSPRTASPTSSTSTCQREVVELRRAVATRVAGAAVGWGPDHKEHDLQGVRQRPGTGGSIDHNTQSRPSDRQRTTRDLQLTGEGGAGWEGDCPWQQTSNAKIRLWVAIAAGPTALAGIEEVNSTTCRRNCTSGGLSTSGL